MWNRKQKQEMKQENKFAGKRKYAMRAGTPNKTLTRLNDLHELLQCDPDEHGYVVTTFKEMNELTEMDVNILTIMIQQGLLKKMNTGSTPKFKYKWDTIKPTMDMAVKLAETKANMKKNDDPEPPENVVSESKPESINPDSEKEENQEIIDENKISVHTTDEFDSSVIVDSKVDATGTFMTMHVNLKKLGIRESDVLNAVLAIDTNK